MRLSFALCRRNEFRIEELNAKLLSAIIRNPKSEMKITVYEKPTCTTCRKLNKLFEENGVDYTKVNYFIDALSEEKLRELLKKANLSPFDVLRKAEPVYKELKISEVKDADKLIKLIAHNPSILQRPIVEVGEKAVLARPIENALELIKSAK
jgi:arsenate reductase